MLEGWDDFMIIDEVVEKRPVYTHEEALELPVKFVYDLMYLWSKKRELSDMILSLQKKLGEHAG